jgi:hypothetical protein
MTAAQAWKTITQVSSYRLMVPFNRTVRHIVLWPHERRMKRALALLSDVITEIKREKQQSVSKQ